MQIDVIKLGSHILQVLGKTCVTAAVMPHCRHLVPGICKHRAEAIVDIHLLPILAFDFIDSRLRDKVPDAERIGEVCQGNFSIGQPSLRSLETYKELSIKISFQALINQISRNHTGIGRTRSALALGLYHGEPEDIVYWIDPE